eukprot:4901975-Amphidinium_carterae.1
MDGAAESSASLWYEADYRAKWGAARVLCAEVAATLLDLAGLETGLCTLTFRQEGHLEGG